MKKKKSKKRQILGLILFLIISYIVMFSIVVMSILPCIYIDRMNKKVGIYKVYGGSK